MGSRKPTKAVVVALLLALVLVGIGAGAWLAVGGAEQQAEEEAAQSQADGEAEPVEILKDPKAELSEEDKLQNRIQKIVDGMTVEEKCAQLFVVRPEDVTGVAAQTLASEATQKALEQYPVGGICYFAKNLIDPTQTKEMLANTKAYYEEITGLPLFCAVDEEGGTVLRIGSNAVFGVERVGNASACASTEEAQADAMTIGNYLTELGFNVDFAPVADIASIEGSSMALRSFGTTADEVVPKVKAQVEGYLSTGVLCCAKHFPGIGGTVADSHDGSIVSDKNVDEMLESELKPFEAAIESGVPFVMVGHLSCPNITGNMLPASLSADVIEGVLRDRLGYDGIVITDSLGMGAVLNVYASDRVGVEVIKAGADMILMPADFATCYQGVVDAVNSGELSEERIDASLKRILRVKLSIEK